MLLTIDVGNSETTAGLFEGNRLSRQWRLTTAQGRTPDEWGVVVGSFLQHAGYAGDAVTAVCLASVAPAVTRSLSLGLARLTGQTVAELSSTADLPLALDVDEPLAVGADRIANALGALELWQEDAVVIDFGTATTFDCVTADRRFIGGPIMPGLRTSADELTQKAARLPATELTAPTRVIGRRTDDAIRAGVLYGASDAVDGMIRRIRAEWPTGNRPRVVATGGLAEVLVPFTTEVDEVAQGLTMEGIRVAAQHLGLHW